jgi:DNA-binding MarR family transcriptional regulator
MEDSTLAGFGRHIAFLARVVEAALGEMSLTGYRVLTLVAQGDERSSAIAGRLAISRPTVTYAVDALVNQGLLTRAAVPGDRRVVRLEITGDGRRALADADRRVAERLRPVFDRLDDPGGVFDAMGALQVAVAADRVERVERARAAVDTKRGRTGG